MLNQLGIISIFLAPTIFLFDNSNIINYLPSTFLLALLTTAIGHTLFVSSIKKFSITSASLISSLQPVYGILLAFAFLSEVPKTSTIIGGVIILSTVVFESLRLRKLDGEY
jgi:drug/metabolite transporter (DMT)-like permease